VNTAAINAPGCAGEIEGKFVMPRERHVSPSGAQSATNPRIRYCRGLRG
jgi:hypothetical protein